jgi:hypothetical protein
LSLAENLRTQNSGRELVFSAAFCYNKANEKAGNKNLAVISLYQRFIYPY